MPDRLYASIKDLPLRIDGAGLDDRSVTVAAGWERHTTLIRLHGGGLQGVGEDVVYEGDEQAAFQQAGAPGGLQGEHTLEGFCQLLDSLEPLGPAVARETSHHYRRWAFESAALDLALRQAGLSLAEALGLAVRPVRFVVSMGLGDPPSAQRVRDMLEHDPGMRFKLDATEHWDDALVAELAATGAVDCIDLKAFYTGTVVDNPPNPELYRRVCEGFPQAVIEDAMICDDTREILMAHRDRLSFDAPVHSLDDVTGFGFPLRVLNIKPSRFGSLRNLFATYEHCREHGIAAYGGGQFELAEGRGQIQYLASLFHPDTANDVAPAEYNLGVPGDALPRSPLAPAADAVGFRWG
jgi:hypothetical protein